MIVYHATSNRHLESIMKEGLRPNSYWSSDTGIRDYYMETIEEEGETPVVLTIELDRLIELSEGRGVPLSPDYPGIEEPITGVLGRSEEDLHGQWQQSPKDWRACVELIGSLRCPFGIPSDHFNVLKRSDEVIQDPLAPMPLPMRRARL